MPVIIDNEHLQMNADWKGDGIHLANELLFLGIPDDPPIGFVWILTCRVPIMGKDSGNVVFSVPLPNDCVHDCFLF